MDAALLTNLNKARSQRQPVAVVTNLATHRQELIAFEKAPNHLLSEELVNRFRSGKSGIITSETGEYFVQIHLPAPRLIIIGAVHISQALAPMAQACDFDVTIIDPRTAFATPERFAGFKLLPEWPQDVQEHMVLDPYTALVAVTHDPKIDDMPLQMALESGSFYIGALGSRKTHAKRYDRLQKAGVSEDALSRIAAPIGLNIGAANPPEIAVAIMAQMIDALRKGETA